MKIVKTQTQKLKRTRKPRGRKDGPEPALLIDHNDDINITTALVLEFFCLGTLVYKITVWEAGKWKRDPEKPDEILGDPFIRTTVQRSPDKEKMVRISLLNLPLAEPSIEVDQINEKQFDDHRFNVFLLPGGYMIKVEFVSLDGKPAKTREFEIPLSTADMWSRNLLRKDYWGMKVTIKKKFQLLMKYLDKVINDQNKVIEVLNKELSEYKESYQLLDKRIQALEEVVKGDSVSIGDTPQKTVLLPDRFEPSSSSLDPINRMELNGEGSHIHEMALTIPDSEVGVTGNGNSHSEVNGKNSFQILSESVSRTKQEIEEEGRRQASERILKAEEAKRLRMNSSKEFTKKWVLRFVIVISTLSAIGIGAWCH